MQTERVTILMSTKRKAAVAARAAARGLSMGEYIRRKVEDEDELTHEQEAELAALVAQVNETIPKMRASIERSIATLDKTHKKVDAVLRDAGIRQ